MYIGFMTTNNHRTYRVPADAVERLNEAWLARPPYATDDEATRRLQAAVAGLLDDAAMPERWPPGYRPSPGWDWRDHFYVLAPVAWVLIVTAGLVGLAALLD